MTLANTALQRTARAAADFPNRSPETAFRKRTYVDRASRTSHRRRRACGPRMSRNYVRRHDQSDANSRS